MNDGRLDDIDDAMRQLAALGLADLLGALGTDALCQQLLAFMQKFIATPSLELFFFRRSPSLQSIVDVAYLGSATDESASLETFHESGRAYVADHSLLGRHCVDYQYILALRSCGVHLTSVEQPDSEEQRRFYQEVYFDDGSIAELISYAGMIDERVFTLTLSRDVDMPRFTAQEHEHLLQLGNILLPLLSKHYELLPAITSVKREPYGLRQRFEQLLQQDAVQLSARECDICVCILMGMSAADIATHLGIAPSSVVTYKQRAFAKLGVSNQQALFDWCFLPHG
ncbi:helix-turn-helix transcriptional regulator [Pseudomonas zhanjiangensis]|uniref:Helix-turn-helix transcriptional regulator n=1 Tax=Pseudomonas zhanjiangensis TaxID=3239015 RepID=A0ABV3YZ09_9PSED